MKEKKNFAECEESEQKKNVYQEKQKKAEINKKKIEEKREQTIENKRKNYNSNRVFVELLQSLIKSK